MKVVPRPGPPLRVVIIDDTPDLRELMRLALTRGGMDVVGEAGDGLEGIETVRAQRPDVVLLDLSMPVMDGLDALPRIRTLAPRARIIVLSGFGATQMAERALSMGADGYLQKGMSLTRILDYVRDLTSSMPDRRPSRPSVPSRVDEQVAPAPPSSAPTGSDPAPGRGLPAAAWEALALAPYGVVEVSDEPLVRVVRANPTAQRLLGNRAGRGTPLGSVAPALDGLVAFHRLDAEAGFEVELTGAVVQATLRRAGTSSLIFLDSSAADVAMLRRAIATTAHEIRGPVAVLGGVAETVEMHVDDMDPAQRSRLMHSVARQARMLDSITADLLTAAQIQRGGLRIMTQDTDPVTVVEGIVTDRFSVDVTVEDHRHVLADPLRLEQMLSNLLTNAHKYGRPAYVVTVRAHDERADSVCIDVADSGDGVPEEFLGDLFQEFSRAAGTVATGTGLGLYVVRTLAQAQGGDVSYAPREGGGSVFTLCLPAVP